MRRLIADNAHMFEQIRSTEAQSTKRPRTSALRRFSNGGARIRCPLGVRSGTPLSPSLYRAEGREGHRCRRLRHRHAQSRRTIWTHPKTKLTGSDVEAFNAQYPSLEVRPTAFHDRFLILNGSKGYLGASLKDAGKSFAVTRIEDAEFVQAVLSKLDGIDLPGNSIS